MKSIIFFFALSVVLISCQTSDNEPYQNFSDSDYQFIPENYQEIGEIITFRNEQNEEVQIKTTFYNLNKEFESGYGFGQPTISDSYYYDDLWITIELLNVDTTNQEISYCNSIKIHIYKTGDGRLSTKLQIPFYDEPFCIGTGFSEFSPYENLIQMEITNVSYSKVKIVVPNGYFTFYNDSQIDKVYYDLDKGIVGFDDTQQNKEFRLVTE